MQKISPIAINPLASAPLSNAQDRSSQITQLYQSIVPFLESCRLQVCQFLWSANCITTESSQNEAATISQSTAGMIPSQKQKSASQKEHCLELQNQEKALEYIKLARELLKITPNLALSALLDSSKLHYSAAAKELTQWIDTDSVTPEQIESFFTSTKQTLDSHRYKSNTVQIAQITNLIRDLIDFESPDEYEPIAGTIRLLITGQVIPLLQDLGIKYHNIQHTLEVTLGTAQSMAERFKKEETTDPKQILLPIVAALFHDIAYSNTKEMLTFIANLSPDQYKTQFTDTKRDEAFLANFEALVLKIKTFLALPEEISPAYSNSKIPVEKIESFKSTPLTFPLTPENKVNKTFTGAEMHLYHVHLSQILLPLILQKLPYSCVHKKFLLQPDSLEKMCAMISLTDINPKSKEYQENRRQYLAKHDLLASGESLVLSDLLTQLSTSDRLEKGLYLYDEFVKGNDLTPCNSALALMAGSTWFYENIAKKQFHPEALATLDQHFHPESNPYRTGIGLIFLFYKLFEPLYQKLTTPCIDAKTITDKDLHLLRCLQINGLQKEIVDLFQATQCTRKNQNLPPDLQDSLYAVLKDKDSLLEIAIGDEIRITLLKEEALFQNTSEMKGLLNTLKKPALLIDRSFDLLLALQEVESRSDKDTLLDTIEKLLQSIPENKKGLSDLKIALKAI